MNKNNENIVYLSLKEVFIENNIEDSILMKILENNIYIKYDVDDDNDNIILNNKIVGILDIIEKDEEYISNNLLSNKSFNKINKILKSKF